MGGILRRWKWRKLRENGQFCSDRNFFVTKIVRKTEFSSFSRSFLRFQRLNITPWESKYLLFDEYQISAAFVAYQNCSQKVNYLIHCNSPNESFIHSFPCYKTHVQQVKTVLLCSNLITFYSDFHSLYN